MLPPEIASMLDADDPGDLNIVVENARYDSDNMVEVTFAIQLLDDQEVKQRWIVRSRALRNFRIEHAPVDFIEERQEHPLLWPFNAPHSQLYIKHSARDPNALHVAIATIHEREFDTSCGIGTFLNLVPSLDKLCRMDHGLFADGPTPLLKLYATALQEAGCGPYFVGERSPIQWMDGRWVEDLPSVSVLLFGKSWIIAEEFQWEQRSVE